MDCHSAVFSLCIQDDDLKFLDILSANDVYPDVYSISRDIAVY